MVIFMLVGIFSSFVAIALVIAILKCCTESLADGKDNHQNLRKTNTYQSRYANTNRRNTYDTDDLTEVWTTNDDNGTDTRWNSSNIEGSGNEGDSRLKDGCDSTSGLRNDSKPEGDNDSKLEKGDSTLGKENDAISGAEAESKLGGSAHDHGATTISEGSHSVFGRSEHDSAFGAGSHSTFGGGSHSAFGGHDSNFGGEHDTGHNTVGMGHDSGFGGDSGGGGYDGGGYD